MGSGIQSCLKIGTFSVGEYFSISLDVIHTRIDPHGGPYGRCEATASDTSAAATIRDSRGYLVA
jgi:hypothetical protein